MAVFTPRSAKNAKVRIGAVTYTAKKWTVDPVSDELDTTNFEGAGFYECIHGIIAAGFTIDSDFDCANNPFDSPPSMRAGATLSGVKLYINDVAGPFWLFAFAQVFGSPNEADVKQALKLSIRAKGTGVFTFPTGAG